MPHKLKSCVKGLLEALKQCIIWYMARKLSKLLMEHDSMQINGTLGQTFTPTPTIEVGKDISEVKRGFDIPEDIGQTSLELQDEVGPQYMRACLEMANRAMRGETNPLTEGDLPQKMALMLAHKMFPSRKVGEKPPQESPAKNKQTARALKALIKNLSEEAEYSEPNNLRPDGVEVASVDGKERTSRAEQPH